MKEKIYNKLKQEYSSLGLGESVLQAQAESLANSGIVTDDNMDAVIKAQMPFLEAIQKANDKRATEAAKTAKENALKEFEEAAKKKAEEEAKKAEEEARKKAEEDAKKAEEEKKKAEEEARKKAEEEAEKKRLEALQKEVPEWYLKEIEEREKKAKAEREKFEALLNELRGGRQKDNDEFSKTLKEMQEKNEKLLSDYEALRKEGDEAKAKAKAKQRSEYILSKAKELGIPQDRIDEGFVIAGDAEESAIDEYLSKVSSNIKTRELPKDKHFQQTDDKAAKDIVDSVVKKMIR